MRGRVEEEAGRGETTTKQTSAVVIVIFMECLPSARPCAQHFTGTNLFNSHNSSIKCAEKLILSLFYNLENRDPICLYVARIMSMNLLAHGLVSFLLKKSIA